MRVKCHNCGKPAVITHRVPLTHGVDDLYCTCKHCGSRFVSTLAFKHPVEPATPAAIAAALLLSLPPADRARVVQQAELFTA
ncbi:Ogr/Delta-like zinc finger [Methylomagnum ishizawai]|uniref:Ogr/Delta-like zinc finger n=1 Tax=Methylomagnum ishizawai TaxID=1760988 RepID=A0A1Y6D8N0_9GAMM|nr:ogr/Delta-like zinc finger family protein [Methylomagnum ishizawai]SMF96145.1 Ogr/Delta-like zinc finger [Methylomagnum ishizawai]